MDRAKSQKIAILVAPGAPKARFKFSIDLPARLRDTFI
jgi:hypothetical protein